jgi:hypothetical protein
VIVVIKATGVPSNYFSTAEAAQKAANSTSGVSITFQPISGVGDEAASYTYASGSATETGVIAQQGGTLAGVFTSMLTGASISQCENLVKQLL